MIIKNNLLKSVSNYNSSETIINVPVRDNNGNKLTIKCYLKIKYICKNIDYDTHTLYVRFYILDPFDDKKIYTLFENKIDDAKINENGDFVIDRIIYGKIINKDEVDFSAIMCINSVIYQFLGIKVTKEEIPSDYVCEHDRQDLLS